MLGILVMLIIIVLVSYALMKSLVDTEILFTCNKRNKELRKSPTCNRYMIRAHYENFEMTIPFSFTGLTDYTPPEYEVIEKYLGFNELNFKKAIIKPQPWCYEVVNEALTLIKESFYRKIGDNICDVQYDLLLLAGSSIDDGYERTIVNGTESDIMNYSFSYDLW